MNLNLTNILLVYCFVAWAYTAIRLYSDLPNMMEKVYRDAPPMLDHHVVIIQFISAVVLVGVVLISPILWPIEWVKNMQKFFAKLRLRYRVWKINRMAKQIGDPQIQQLAHTLSVTVKEHGDKMV